MERWLVLALWQIAAMTFEINQYFLKISKILEFIQIVQDK